jgi:hypothetical protein
MSCALADIAPAGAICVTYSNARSPYVDPFQRNGFERS